MESTRIVALAGNPNAGKTTLFNELTGSRQRVGNWAGVTVERKEGFLTTPTQRITIVDLPGTYSLTTLSQQGSLDEQIACSYILSREADILINVVDASNIERNLYLTLQLLEQHIPCIVALNMVDIARSQGIAIDISALERRLGCPVISLVSTRSEGIETLKALLDGPIPALPSLEVDYPPVVRQAVERVMPFIPHHYPPWQQHWVAINILEGDIRCRDLLSSPQSLESLCAGLQKQHNVALAIADARYTTIIDLCQASSNVHLAPSDRLTARIDAVLLNRWFGVPFFFMVMYLMFILSINFGGALQPLFDGGSSALFIDGTQWLGYQLHAPHWLILLMAQGVGVGINTMMPLLPQIGIMYLCMAFLEDSGYMARAAFVIDRLMQSLGLPGKSFVPLIVGFGCNVPSVMTSRALNTPREQLITIMMAPFMSCSARLAIFAVFSATFFGQHGASMVFSLYLLGIVVAVLTGILMKYLLTTSETVPFVMELPVYHVPHTKTLLRQAWQRLQGFAIRAGKVIVLSSVLIGTLTNFTIYCKPTNNVDHSALAVFSKKLTPVLIPMGVDKDNWQATVGLITGAIAKEIVVGTLNTLYTTEQMNSNPFDPDAFHLLDQLSGAVADTWQSVKDFFSLSVFENPIEASKGDGNMSDSATEVMTSKFGGSAISAYSYLIFALLYVPCVSVMGAITRESSRGWMLVSLAWGIDAGYSLAALFYQAFTFSQHPQYSATVMAVVIVFNSLLIACLYRYRDRFYQPSLAINSTLVVGLPAGDETTKAKEV